MTIWGVQRPHLRFFMGLSLFLSVCATARGQGFPGHWVARWIWDGGEATPYHYFLMARRNLNLAQGPQSARLVITVADRYLLYVNGAYLGRGPARSDARWKSYDTYDLKQSLRPGKNTIAVLAYHYGCANNYTRDDRAGLFAQLEVEGVDGKREILGTGPEWRVHHAQGWDRDVDPINTAVGVTEIYEANKDPENWAEPDFDDSSWESAFVIPDTDCPWNYLEARQTPMLREREVFPQKVVGIGEVEETPYSVQGYPPKRTINEVAERMAADLYVPLQYARFENPNAVLRFDGQAAGVQSFPFKKVEDPDPRNRDEWLRSPYIVVDFGRQVFGYPRIRLDGPAQGIVEMAYGPMISQGRVMPMANGLRYADRYVMRPGKQTWQTFEYKQFRYIEVVFRHLTAPVLVDSISVDSYEYPAPLRGSFECSDALLNKLWKACIDTVYLSMEDTLVVDSRTERRSFTADGGHGLWPVWAAFGDTAISDWYFRLISRGPTLDGMLRAVYPGTETVYGWGVDLRHAAVYELPLEELDAVGGLTFTGMFGEYYEYFQRAKLAADIYPALANLAGWFQRHADDTFLAYNLPYFNLVDWVREDMRGANFETNAEYYHSLMTLHEIAEALGKHDDAATWLAQANQVRDSLRKLHWNATRQLYTDCVTDGRQSETYTETANGMAVLFGIATDEQVPQIVQRLLDPKTDILRATVLYYTYTTEALIKAGALGPALDQMRERYAPMVNASEVPTIWDAWGDPAVGPGEASEAHFGGTGPAWTLSKHVLGVYPIGAGFQKCRIAPQTGELQWARGIMPTIKGDVRVEWKRDGSRFVLDAGLPAGLDGEIVLPRDKARPMRISMYGKAIEVRAGAQKAPGLTVTEEEVTIPARSGDHHVEATTE